LAIDVRNWQRQELLDPPGVCFLLMRGRYDNINVEVNTDYVVLKYVSESGAPQVEPIALARTPCHYGGTRPWFLCPSCHRQCAKLFLRRGRFFCRVCHRLGYVSQLAASGERPRIMAQRIRRRLGGDPSLCVPFPPKPDGMPWRTYYRLREKGEQYEQRAFAGLAAWVERFKGPMR
jgi:hypothetical protein